LQPSEDVLHDVLSGRPVAHEKGGEPDKFEMVRAEHLGDARGIRTGPVRRGHTSGTFGPPNGCPPPRGAHLNFPPQTAPIAPEMSGSSDNIACEPVGAGNYVTLCGLGIFVDQAAGPIAPQDGGSRTFFGATGAPGGRMLVQRAVRPMRVVAAPRGAVLYRPRSGQGREEMSLGCDRSRRLLMICRLARR